MAKNIEISAEKLAAIREGFKSAIAELDKEIKQVERFMPFYRKQRRLF